MHEPWKILLFSSLALGGAAKDMFDTGMIVQKPGVGLPGTAYVLDDNNTNLGSPRTRFRSIDLSQIVPAVDAAGNSRCCPFGTVNDGTGCVFPESSVCPDGTTLDGNVCVSDKPPQCPDGLLFNGQTCISEKGPGCSPESKFNGEACESELPPKCPAGQVALQGSL
ncbi:hypothetical protein FALCPG4_015124 [Fusarium falciforme]